MFTFNPENYAAGGHQKIDIADSVVSLFASYLTLIKPTSGDFSGKMASGVEITVETSGIYYTFDNTNPDTAGANGHALAVGQWRAVYGWDNVKRLKFIRQGAVSGVIKVTPLFTSVGVHVSNPT